MIRSFDHSYTLVAKADAAGDARTIELQASEPYGAMQVAQRELPEREIELLEDGHSLGTMECTREGFWVVLPVLHASKGA